MQFIFMYIVLVHPAAIQYWLTLEVYMQWTGVPSRWEVNDSHPLSTMETGDKHWSCVPSLLGEGFNLNKLSDLIKILIHWLKLKRLM